MLQFSKCNSWKAQGQAHRAPARRPFLAAAAAPSGKQAKGFGPATTQTKKTNVDGCPCGSGKTYKSCCKPLHAGTSKSSPSVEATVRARFCAILKKDVSYLMRTTSPFLHSSHYGTEPGAAAHQLEDDLWNTVEHYEYSNLKIREVRPSEKPNEATAVFQYAFYDKRMPYVDDQGNVKKIVRIEESVFTREAEDDLWKFTDYKMVDVPEALARSAEQQAQDMSAAGSSSSSGSDAAASSSSTAAAS